MRSLSTQRLLFVSGLRLMLDYTVPFNTNGVLLKATFQLSGIGIDDYQGQDRWAHIN